MPERILIEKYPGKWTLYVKDYDLEEGAYYSEFEYCTDFLTGCCIQLYPDGHLAYLWNGREHRWDKKWKVG